MTEKFENLLKEIVEKKIPTYGFDIVNGSLSFEIGGFSKSGTAKIYESDGKIWCLTRYNTLDEIEDFESLVYVAYRWGCEYINRAPFNGYDESWLPYFKEYNLV